MLQGDSSEGASKGKDLDLDGPLCTEGSRKGGVCSWQDNEPEPPDVPGGISGTTPEMAGQDLAKQWHLFT